MHPVLALTLGMAGAAALVRWCFKEVHRVNVELDSIRGVPPADPIDRNALPTLRRDPATGEYRPQ
jgi:hypothetical protein